MLPVVYFLCSAAVHTATENWKLQFVLVTEKGVWVLSTVYSMPLTSWLGMWFEQEKLGTYTGSWPPCLAHGSVVDCPLKPQRTCSLLLPSGQSQQGQSVLGQHPSREVFHTHPEHGRVGGSSTGSCRELSSTNICLIPVWMNQLPWFSCSGFPFSSGWRDL